MPVVAVGPGRFLPLPPEDMRIKSRAVYFLRNVPDQKEVKKDIACDGGACACTGGGRCQGNGEE
eukprot:380099-Pyramimonas_sp.AAC.1